MSSQSPPANNITGFHIEPTNICTLKCAGCARTRFIKQWPQHWHNHSINIDHLMQFLDCDLAGKTITLCGNYGDPIYHPDFLELVTQLKKKLCRIHIVTNGSYRTADWWQQLVSVLDASDLVIFSVDGLPKNFRQYRENADWPSIERAMKICAASTVATEWKFIVFSFNQHDIPAAQQLSQSLGIGSFRVEKSERFDQETEHLKPSIDFLGARYVPQTKWKQQHTAVHLDPKCANGKEHFISADGHYAPCCFLQDHRFYYKTMFGKNKSSYSIANTKLSELLTAPTTVEFYKTLPQQPGCQFNCPQTL